MAGELSKPMTIYQGASDLRMQLGHHAYLADKSYPLPTALTFSRAGVIYAPYQVGSPVLQPSVANITISADDVTITGVEIAGISNNRVSAQSGPNPTDIDYYRLMIMGKRITLQGCIIHDITELNIDHAAASFTLRDCIVYNMGWLGSDNWHGHQFYAQNDGGGPLRIINCIFAQSGAYGVHLYGNIANLLGLHITNLIQFNPKFAVGGEVNAPVDDVIMTDSVLWNPSANFGRSSVNCGSLTLTGNYYGLQAPIISSAWQNVVNTGNVTGSGGANVVKVFPCTTPNKVAHIAVLNWEQLGAVDVTIDGLTVGATYKLRNAYDPMVDVTEFTYAGGAIALPFIGRTIAKPYGFDSALATLDPRFGAWQLEAA